jgi:hypothetical protein
MPPKRWKTAATSRLIGYARVSTEEQGTDPQLDELHFAGCITILKEHGSGADRSRTVLTRLLREMRAGETLVVVRLDRLAGEGIIETSLLDRARSRQSDDRLVRLIAGIKAAAPDGTLQQIAAPLEAMRERTPRGGTRWPPSSVKHLLARAERFGLTRTASVKVRLGNSVGMIPTAKPARA